MAKGTTFRKPDRYKANGYEAYNSSMADDYDAMFLVRFCQLPLWHRTAVEEIGAGIESAHILDVGCGTGSLLLELARSAAASLAGADLAPRMLDVARARLAAQHVQAELRVGDGHFLW